MREPDNSGAKPSVIVLGGGVSGLGVALALLRRGHGVTLRRQRLAPVGFGHANVTHQHPAAPSEKTDRRVQACDHFRNGFSGGAGSLLGQLRRPSGNRPFSWGVTRASPLA